MKCARAGWAAVGVLVFLPLALLAADAVWARGRLFGPFRELASPGIALLFLRSAGTAAAAALAASLLGTGLALLIETRRVPARRALRLLALAPLLIPPYMQVAAWRPLLGGAPLNGDWARPAALVLILGAAWSPLVFFFASQGIRGIAGEVLDAARLAPLGEWAVMRRVIVPLALPSIACGAALVLCLSLLDPETPGLLGETAYATFIFLEVAHGPGAAFVAAVPVMVLVLLLMAGVDRWARGRGFAVTSAEGPRAPSGPLEPWAVLLLLICAGLLAIFPLARLVSMAGSPRRFAEAWGLYGDAILEGAPITLGTAALAATLAALTAARSGRPSRFAGLAAWLPIAVPGTVLGVALIHLYNRPGLDLVYQSRWILVVAGVARFFPAAYHALAAHLRSVPADLWDAAALAGGSPASRAFRLRLPLYAPGLGLGAGAVALLQSGELAAAVLLAPPGHRPVPVVISAELHYNVDLEVPAALCLYQVASVLLVVAVLRGGAALLGRGGAQRLDFRGR